MLELEETIARSLKYCDILVMIRSYERFRVRILSGLNVMHWGGGRAYIDEEHEL